MNLKALLLALLLGGWMVGSWWYYKCKICNCCAGAADTPTAAAAALPSQRPLTFKWSDANTITTTQYGAYRDSILALGDPGDTMLITGYYFKDEPNTGRLADMGLARAENVKTLMAARFPADRIKIASQMVPEPPNARTQLFESAGFSFLKPALNENTSTIVEADDVALIYFPFNSDVRKADANVDAYLRKLAEKHRQTTATFSVVGHTDSIGSEQSNYNFGMRRANAIKNLLIKKGVAAKRIQVDSKGETQPAEPNSTEDGRRRNRRTEVKVLSN